MVVGLHAVSELLRTGQRPTRQLVVAAERQQAKPVMAIMALARAHQVPVKVAPYLALDDEGGTTAHQGVLARAEPVAAVPFDQLLDGPMPFILVLDGLTDPGNLGAVLRTAACAGVTGVVVARQRSAALTPAALKAAAGAAEHVPLAMVPGVPSALVQMSKAGTWTVGLSPDGTDDLWSTPVLDGPVALVLGSEGRGLSHLAAERCDVLARIPQVGPLGSLNVAAAAAVACFEVARRRQGTNGPAVKERAGA